MPDETRGAEGRRASKRVRVVAPRTTQSLGLKKT